MSSIHAHALSDYVLHLIGHNVDFEFTAHHSCCNRFVLSALLKLSLEQLETAIKKKLYDASILKKNV